ncbi:COG4-domain-containing protein [Laetiporus sulphureus 93-53]|uniref:Conserved oligomeric Golgi complex subunit 4 n=1 Tax=Laetiporus sulphureus 93-53 TaxID=1314785 RepID=A0A165G685_9APHY|nr:COG4-domain-containing protein [Laetiporus sulphureus 93-53]KZT09882.1 COG4-domain-containing protein [Laetiporus sulphureus 93-53]
MSATIRDSHKLATLPEILSSLTALQSEEDEIASSLAQILSAREPVLDSLSRLQSLAPRLDELCTEAYAFVQKVSVTAQTAENVGGRVRSLDEEMRRVREAADRVSQVMELKTSLEELHFSMEDRDWESATRHCARAMALPTEVLLGPFAEIAVPTSESHLPPAQTLQAAREQLLAVFRKEFEKASRSRDAASTSRFFKLFPAIGWEAEGLQAYAAFVVELIKVRAPASAKTSSPLYYITSLTALFENIAMIIDQHQPIVEKYYGPGKMAPVIERLLHESDRVVKGLVEGWEEERSMRRKLIDTSKSYAASPASAVPRRQTLQQGYDGEEGADARDVDRVLSEAVGMSGRWSLFRKFAHERLRPDAFDEENHDEKAPLDRVEDGRGLQKQSAPSTNGSTENLPEGLRAVEACATKQLIEDLLKTYYIPLETWYTNTAIDKAHRLSHADLLQSPVVTTTPDDAFYILKVVLSRMLSCGSVRAVQQTSENLKDVMDHAYVAVIKKKLDDVYRTGGAAGAGSKGEKAERENRQAFIILLNDLDISSSHMERLVKELNTSALVTQYYLETEAESVKRSLSSFLHLVPRFRSALRAGVEQLFNQLMRPRLRTFIPDVYKDVSYVLDEGGYSAAEYNDVVRKRFAKSWENLVDGYKELFTETNYRLFIGLALDVLVRPWERFVVTLKYSELGAVRFDQDLRSITSYLSSQTAFGDVREKFVRLQQISILLNLDSEEDIGEFYNESGITWQLGEQEARMIAGLRI